MSERTLLDPSTIPSGLLYRLVANSVVPRPIALVSSLSADGVPNLAPFSFFMVGGVNPVSLVFAPVRGAEGRKKDTLRNIEETGEYVINLVDRSMADHMNAAAATVPSEVSEWDLTSFTPGDSAVVKPKVVSESPLSFEMKVFQVVHHGEGVSSASYVMGEAVRIHVAPSLWNDGEAGSLAAIGRLGGADYVDLSGPEIFALSRPR